MQHLFKAVIVRLDVVMAQRKVSGKELAQAIGVTEANLSLLKKGHVKGIRFETLAKICNHLNCQPGDVLTFQPENNHENNNNLCDVPAR